MRRTSTIPPVIYIFLPVVIVTALAHAAAGVPPVPEPSLDSKVDALFSEWNNPSSPGAAVAIVKDSRVIYRKGFGCAQLEYGVPITPSTVFHVASLSKQFTAMAVSMLEAAGKLSEDDDIRKYVPELPDFGRPITIRHLLNHTSGLRDQWELLILSGWRMDDVITQAHIMDRLERQKELNFAPGEQYLYSNSGFTLLAEIVSRVSGRPFTDWTRDNIFKPLGMTSTHFHLDHQEIVRNRAYSYEEEPGKGFVQSVLNYANVGATSLFTTVEDMAKWMHNFDDKRVGGAAVMQRMVTKGVLNDHTEISYARGIVVGEYKGLRSFEHGGGDAGFRSYMLYFPDERFGVAVFSNLASFNPGNLSHQIADIYLAPKLKQAPVAPGAPKPALEPVSLPLKSLEAFTGTYWIEANQTSRMIVLDKDKLLYVRAKDNQSELVPVSKTAFLMKGIATHPLVSFANESAGGYETFTMTEDNMPPVVGTRTKPYAPNEDGLKQYAGTYYSDELDTRYDLKLNSGALHVQIGHNDDMSLVPLEEDFFSAGNFAKIRFLRDGNGAITGLTVSTDRVRNLKFTRLPR